MHACAGLDAGFLVTADHVIAFTQGPFFPYAVVEIQNAASLLDKERVTRPDPASIGPRANCICAEPAPNRRTAHRGGDTPTNGFLGNIAMAQSRELQSELLGQLTRQRLYFHDDLRGEKCEVALALAAHPDRPSVRRRTAFATDRQSERGSTDTRQSACSASPQQRGE